MKKILVIVIASALALASSSAIANKEDAGTIIGGLLGGIIGNQLGKGKIGGTIAGTVIGALIGNSIGEELDDQDREELADAQNACLNGEADRQYRWGRSGGRPNGEFVCVDGYHRRTKTTCREIRSVTYHRGEKEVRKGYYCKTKGNWTSVSVKDVDMSVAAPRLNPAPRQNQPSMNTSLSLLGYCKDRTHKQFAAAKDFAYNRMNLGMNDAINWANEYNETHRCGTLAEYADRYEQIFDLAYNIINLNLTDARTMALAKVETTTAEKALRMRKQYQAIHNLTYNVMNLNFSQARAISLQWLNKDGCEGPGQIQRLTNEYQREFDFAYNGMNRSYSAARTFAANKIKKQSTCGELL